MGIQFPPFLSFAYCTPVLLYYVIVHWYKVLLNLKIKWSFKRRLPQDLSCTRAIYRMSNYCCFFFCCSWKVLFHTVNRSFLAIHEGKGKETSPASSLSCSVCFDWPVLQVLLALMLSVNILAGSWPRKTMPKNIRWKEVFSLPRLRSLIFFFKNVIDERLFKLSVNLLLWIFRL